MSTPSTPATGSAKFPPGIPFIVGNEAAERFSFYGMRAILALYIKALLLGFIAKDLRPSQFKEAYEAVGAVAVTAAETQANVVFHTFAAGVYAFPMIGAILADRLFGKYRVIIWVSLIYCAGHAALAFFGKSMWGVVLGLGLIAIGSGGIKPCVSANVGDQFDKSNSSLIETVYQMFYFSINFGSAFATLVIPDLWETEGPDIAFGLPGILMAVATIVFWMGRGKFVRIPASPGGLLGVLDSLAAVGLFVPLAMFLFGGELSAQTRMLSSIVGLAVWAACFFSRQRMKADDGFLACLVEAVAGRARGVVVPAGIQPGVFAPVEARFGKEARDGVVAVLRVMAVFIMVSAFWGLFDQHSSTWINQAEQMETFVVSFGFENTHSFRALHVLGVVVCLAMLWGVATHYLQRAGKVITGIHHAIFAGLLIFPTLIALLWGKQLNAQQIPTLNPLMVMAIIPVWGPIVLALRRRGVNLSPLRQMTMGMLLTVLSFILAWHIETRIAGGEKVSILAQIPQYFVLTFAEVLVSVTGLEFAYTQAPKRMKSTIMGFWLLCVSFGNKTVAVILHNLEGQPRAQLFLVFASMMFGAAIVFALVAYFYKGTSYLQAAEPAKEPE